jgi:hypothetical protein
MRKAAEWRLGLAIAVLVSVVASADGIADPSSIKSAEHEVVPELPNLENVLRPLTAEGLTRTRQNLIRYVWKGLDPYKLKPSAIDSGARTGNIALVAGAAADAKTISELWRKSIGICRVCEERVCFVPDDLGARA